MKIYLAGFISKNKLDKCIEWRKKLRDFYEQKHYPITFLDPLNGKYFEQISNDGLSVASIPSHAIVHRDYLSVKEADLIIANLNTFEEHRTPTGTICEITWAWSMKKPIIIITEEEQYKFHPFIEYFSSIIVDNVEQLIEKKYINYMYKGMVNAEY